MIPSILPLYHGSVYHFSKLLNIICIKSDVKILMVSEFSDIVNPHIMDNYNRINIGSFFVKNRSNIG